MITHPEVEAYCKTHSTAESGLLKELREYTEVNVPGAQMLSDVLVGRTLQFLLQLLKAQYVVDLGTFTGYSALSMAEALADDATVMTCDQSAEHLQIARAFFAKSPHKHKIQVFEGLIFDCIASVTTTVDFVFIDADKLQIGQYIEAIYPKLRQGGMIVVDNVLWGGEVLKPEDKRAKALDAFNTTIKKDPRFVNVLLPIRDGLNIISKI